MLCGVEKKRKEEECLDSLGFDMRSELNNADDAGGDSSDNCKDVDIVTVLPECSASTMADLEMAGDCRLKENSSVHSRFREQEDLPMDYDGVSVHRPFLSFRRQRGLNKDCPLLHFRNRRHLNGMMPINGLQVPHQTGPQGDKLSQVLERKVFLATGVGNHH
ncbi:hypothetical protein BT93_A0327 [Corymbia citriodora subsp. variegata]|nr:hypothetical protein BT93_A0327 [Corymbia citriodora subsp. variegata]